MNSLISQQTAYIIALFIFVFYIMYIVRFKESNINTKSHVIILEIAVIFCMFKISRSIYFNIVLNN